MQQYQPILELLRLQKRTDVKRAFPEDSNSNIDFNAFYTSLTSKLDLHLSEKDTRNLFYQIDPYSKGIISYKALLNYLDHYENCRLSTKEPFQSTPTVFSGVRVQDNIFEWTVYPELKESHLDVAGDYVYLSRGGVLSFWRRDFTKHFETAITVLDDGAQVTPMATGLVCIPKYKMVAVSTTAADIRFFNCSTYKFQHKFSITWMSGVVINMDCYKSEKLICGDFRGSVFVLKLEASFFDKVHQMADHLDPLNVAFDELGKGKGSGISTEFTAKSHFSNVAKVKYIPSNRTVISCSVNTRRAMMIHDLEKRTSKSFTTEGGITCFGFCEKLNCVATGCIDNSVKIWNPSVNNSCRENLTGHLNSVTHVVIYEKRLWIISADRDRIIRVWDLIRPKCLQIIKFKEADFGRHPFTALYLDTANDKLITATNRVAVLNARLSNTNPKAHSDSELLAFVAYNSIFDCLITVGSRASIALWNPENCNLIYEYTEAHVKSDKEGIKHVVDITAAGLDPSERRLITAGRDGNIKVWNFHLGICLREFKAKHSVLTITFVGFAIYVGGQSGSLSVFIDNDQDEIEDTEWETTHSRAIVSLHWYSSTLLASASSDGQIIIWLRKNADAKLYLKDVTNQDELEENDDSNYPAKRVVKRLRKCGISQILFLQKREMDASVANLVSCGADGRIRFWNVICANKLNKWRLVSKFRAVFRDCDGVLVMATDRKNTFLITGDTMGYIRVYDLDDYYSSYGSEPPNSQQIKTNHFHQFPFLTLKKLIDKNHSQHSKFQPHGKAEFGDAPHLLNCFRAHVGPVLKIAYSNEKEFMASASRKGSVRLWTISGVLIRSFETGNSNIQQNVTSRKSNSPQDVRKVASPLTLHVLNGGKKPRWEQAIKTLKLCHLGHVPDPTKKTPFGWMQKKTDAIGIDLSKEFTLVEDLKERKKNANVDKFFSLKDGNVEDN